MTMAHNKSLKAGTPQSGAPSLSSTVRAMMTKIRLIIALILAFPCFVNAAPGDSPSIFWAALANDVNMAKYYISKGESINVVDEHGMTPLMLAAEKGNYEMVVFLLNEGANPATRTANGVSALELTRNKRVRNLLRAHIENGSNKSLKDRDAQKRAP